MKLAWSLTSSATVTGPITLKINLAGNFNDPTEFAGLRLLHFENGVWVDRTALSPDADAPDFNSRTIRARVSALAPLALARTIAPRPSPTVSLTFPTAGQTLNAPADIVISEFRLRGAGGATDEFVELYNNSDTPATVCATDGSGGWALVSSDGITRINVPNGLCLPEAMKSVLWAFTLA